MSRSRTGVAWAASRVFVGSVLFLGLVGCSNPAPTPTPAVRPRSTRTETIVVFVNLSAAEADWSFVEVQVGEQATLEVAFQPSLVSVGETSGSVRPLDSHEVTEMRLCTSLDDGCELGETWVPFSQGEEFDVTVDWLDRRDFHIAAQFRDSDGEIVPTGPHPDVGVYQEPGSVYRGTFGIIGVVDEETPVDSLPPPVQTALAPTVTPSAVWGSVEIEGGASFVGGTEGTMLPVDVAFQAQSPSAEITSMRVATGACLSEAEMEGSEWEPFAASKTYSVKAFINIRGFYVSVQYRDAEGNVSPVYCDDINVEGEPEGP